MESKLQRKIIAYLEKRGWFALKIIRCNKAGCPDIIALGSDRRIVFIEAKDKGKKADPLQLYRHEQLRDLAFTVIVVDTWTDFITHKTLFK